MRSLFRVSISAVLFVFVAASASAGPAVPATSVESAASEPVTYVHVNLGFERVMAKLDREVFLQLRPTTMDCADGVDASGAEVCEVRLLSALPDDLPAAPANP
jgi:hypothetical protein